MTTFALRATHHFETTPSCACRDTGAMKRGAVKNMVLWCARVTRDASESLPASAQARHTSHQFASSTGEADAWRGGSSAALLSRSLRCDPYFRIRTAAHVRRQWCAAAVGVRSFSSTGPAQPQQGSNSDAKKGTRPAESVAADPSALWTSPVDAVGEREIVATLGRYLWPHEDVTGTKPRVVGALGLLVGSKVRRWQLAAA